MKPRAMREQDLGFPDIRGMFLPKGRKVAGDAVVSCPKCEMPFTCLKEFDNTFLVAADKLTRTPLTPFL